MAEKTTSREHAASYLVERQMRNWELARTQRPGRSTRPGTTVFDFVTISNNIGGGGGELAAQLGKKLRWPVFDREILTEMAHNDEVRARLYKSMDERDLGWFESAFRSFIQDDIKRDDYFHRLTETLLCLARKGPAVFVGRASDLILPKNKGLRVKVISSSDYRINSFAKANNLSLKAAAKRVDAIELGRAQFIRQHFHIELNDPARFDLLINVERIPNRQTIDLILSLLKARKIID